MELKRLILGGMLVGALTVTSISGLDGFKHTNVVYASENTHLKQAKAVLSHLTYSMQTNYMGIKNQSTWEGYVKQVENSIKQIPYSKFKTDIDALNAELARDKSLIMGMARINHVEKSMAPKSEGGYGNSLTMKNVPTWQEYIRLADIDLEKIDKKVFGNQYKNLQDRKQVVLKKLQEIINGDTAEFGTIKSYTGNGYSLERMSAKDDFSTAALAAQNFKNISENSLMGWSTSTKMSVNTAILVDINDKHAGALAGPLVGKYNAPILYTNGGSLNDTTEKAIKQLGIKNVVFVSSKSESFTSASNKLSSIGVKVLDKVVEKDKYDLSMKIANSIKGLTNVHIIDGDKSDDIHKALSVQPMTAYKQVVVFLPTKSKTTEEIRKYNGFQDWLRQQYQSYKTSIDVYDEKLAFFTELTTEDGFSKYYGGESIGYDTNIYRFNNLINIKFDSDLAKTDVVMANGSRTTDLVTAMPLAVKCRTSLVFSGEKVSEIFTKENRETMDKRFNKGASPSWRVSKVYILGDTSVLKEGVERKLRGQD